MLRRLASPSSLLMLRGSRPAPAATAPLLARAAPPPPPPPLLARALASAAGKPGMAVWEAYQTAADTSVSEARKAVFGVCPPEGTKSSRFKSLRRMRKGWMAPKFLADGMRPKPDLAPPGHEYPEANMARHLERHPVNRMLNNVDRLEKLEYNKSIGKSPPKKGAGNRAAKGKK